MDKFKIPNNCGLNFLCLKKIVVVIINRKAILRLLMKNGKEK